MAAPTTVPVRPSEFRALVPTSEDGICAVLVKFIQWMILFWRWYRWAFVHDTGELSDEFVSAICARIDSDCSRTEPVGD